MNAPGERQAALVAVVEAPVAALGQGEHGVADDAGGALAGLVGAVEHEDGQVHADLAGGQPDAVGGVHRRHHVGDQRAQLVVVRRDGLLRPVHDGRSPAGHRPDGAAVGEGAVRRVDGLVGHGAEAYQTRARTVTGATATRVALCVTPSYIFRMSLTRAKSCLKPGGRFGLASTESRDPIGLAVAALNRVAQSDLIDRIGLRKQTEQAVFTATRGGFRTLTTASRTFARAGKKGKPGVRVPAPRRAASST